MNPRSTTHWKHLDATNDSPGFDQETLSQAVASGLVPLGRFAQLGGGLDVELNAHAEPQAADALEQRPRRR